MPFDDRHLSTLPRHIVKSCVEFVHQGAVHPPPDVKVRAFSAVWSAMQRGVDPFDPFAGTDGAVTGVSSPQDALPASKSQDHHGPIVANTIATIEGSSTAFGSRISREFGGTPQEKGTSSTAFKTFWDRDPGAISAFNLYATMTAMSVYRGFSSEELRLIDYTQGRRFRNDSSETSGFGASEFGGFCFSSSSDDQPKGLQNAEDEINARVMAARAEIRLRLVKEAKIVIQKRADRMREVFERNLKEGQAKYREKLNQEHQKELQELEALRLAYQPLNLGDNDAAGSTGNIQRIRDSGIMNNVPALALELMMQHSESKDLVSELAQILITPIDTSSLYHCCRGSSEEVTVSQVDEDAATSIPSLIRERGILKAKLETLEGRIEWHETLERVAEEKLQAALSRTSQLEGSIIEQEQKNAEQEVTLAEQTRRLKQAQLDIEVTRRFLLEEYQRLERSTPQA